MRTKINIISWAVFLTLISHMHTPKESPQDLSFKTKVNKSELIAKKIVKKKGHG